MPEPDPTASAPDPEIALLVTKALALRAEIALRTLDFNEVAAEITALGKGKYSGLDPLEKPATLTVVAASLGSVGAISYSPGSRRQAANLNRCVSMGCQSR